MFGWALRISRISEDLQRISVSVYPYSPGPSQQVLWLIQTVINCSRLVMVWLDDDVHVRDFTILTIWPVSDSVLETLDQARGLTLKMCSFVSPTIPLLKVLRSPVTTSSEPD